LAEGIHELALGTFIVILSLLMWRLTSNFWAWAVFFLSGATFIAWGWIKALRK
jgi:hypothetical protein